MEKHSPSSKNQSDTLHVHPSRFRMIQLYPREKLSQPLRKDPQSRGVSQKTLDLILIFGHNLGSEVENERFENGENLSPRRSLFPR